MKNVIRFTDEDLAAIDGALVQLEQRFAPLIALDAKDLVEVSHRWGSLPGAGCRC